jgi:protein tyrosine phosphatase (PTP) superfamily phosphohydrolase (DUF442 family)
MSNLESIYNFRAISDNLASAGQATEEQFKAVKEAGFELVINLASVDSKYDLANEAKTIADLGIEYINIPVIWNNPTAEDLQDFFDVMEANEGKKIFVHCIANFRVSAFIMLYRTIKKAVPLAEAEQHMRAIWNPEEKYPIWLDFIAKILKEYNIEAGE